MTKDEIDHIIIVSSKHETKPDFFEKKRKEFGCWSKDYSTALIDSFERLYTYLNEIDPYHYLLTKKDGSTSEHELNPVDDSCFDSNFEFLMSLGEVSRPFKNYIELYIETNGEFKGKFTVEELAKIKPAIDAYCSYLKTKNTPDVDINDNPTPKKEKNSEQEDTDFRKALSEIRNSENKFWKGLPMEGVIDHFKVMTLSKSKNGAVYLTTEQLTSFLKKGFMNDVMQPKQKINCSSGEKGFVIKRFYEFYDIAVAQYGHPSKKAKFIKLFSDCFDNWDENTIRPFFKPNKTKEIW